MAIETVGQLKEALSRAYTLELGGTEQLAVIHDISSTPRGLWVDLLEKEVVEELASFCSATATWYPIRQPLVPFVALCPYQDIAFAALSTLKDAAFDPRGDEGDIQNYTSAMDRKIPRSDGDDLRLIWDNHLSALPELRSRRYEMYFQNLADTLAGSEKLPDDLKVRMLAWAREPDTFMAGEVKQGLATNKTSPPELLADLATDPNFNIKYAVARNRRSPPELLAKLHQTSYVNPNESQYVLEALAVNPNTPPRIKELSRWGTILFAPKREQEAKEAFQAAAPDDNEMRVAIVKHLSQDFAKTLLGDRTVDPSIQMAVLRQSNRGPMNSFGISEKEIDEAVQKDPRLVQGHWANMLLKVPQISEDVADRAIEGAIPDSTLLSAVRTRLRDRDESTSRSQRAYSALHKKLRTAPPEIADEGNKWVSMYSHDGAILSELADNPRMQHSITLNQATPAPVLDKILNQPPQRLREHPLAIPDLPFDDAPSLEVIAGHPNATPGILARIADMADNDRVNTALADNPNTSADVLKRFIHGRGSRSNTVSALRNPNMPDEAKIEVIDRATDRSETDPLVGTADAQECAILAARMVSNLKGFPSESVLSHLIDKAPKLGGGKGPAILFSISSAGSNSVTPNILEKLYNITSEGSSVSDRAVLRNIALHPRTPEQLLETLANKREEGEDDKFVQINEAAKTRLAFHNPDFVAKESIRLKMGTNKLRILRDKIESLGRDEAKPSELPKALVQAIGKTGRLPNGNYSARLLQRAVDETPDTRYNISHGAWGGAQLHSEEDSKVLQVNASTETVKKLKAAGVYDTFVKLNEFTSDAHPVGKPHGIGWVRYTGDDKGVHIDEIQSDSQQGFSRQMDSAIDSAVEQGDMSPKAAEAKKKEIARDYPQDHLKKIEEILFGGKHPSELLFEAFHEWARTPQKKTVSLCPNCGEPGYLTGESSYQGPMAGCRSKTCEINIRDQVFPANKLVREVEESPIPIGTPIHIWTAKSKAPLSGWDLSRPLPKHAVIGYEEAPKKAGYEPGTYGEIPTQSNPSYKGEPTFINHTCNDCGRTFGSVGITDIRQIQPQICPSCSSVDIASAPGKFEDAATTYKEVLHKEEDAILTNTSTPRIEDLEKAEPRVWSAGGIRIPHMTHPSRKQFDQNYLQRLNDYFVSPGHNRLTPKTIPINKLEDSHSIDSSNPRIKMYTKMYQGGDPGLPIVVFSRGGRFHVQDGNHRLAAAQAAGLTHLKVLLNEDLKGLRKAEDDLKGGKLPANVQEAFDAVRANAADQKPYVAAEALHHLLGGQDAGWHPQFLYWEGSPHWYLKHQTGVILDPTADQFKKPVPYHEGMGKGFLTKDPSKRARVLMDRVDNSGGEEEWEDVGTLHVDDTGVSVKPHKLAKALPPGHISLDDLHKKYKLFRLVRHLDDYTEDRDRLWNFDDDSSETPISPHPVDTKYLLDTVRGRKGHSVVVKPSIPQVPMHGEDEVVPRVCVGPSLYHCISGILGGTLKTPQGVRQAMDRASIHPELRMMHGYRVLALKSPPTNYINNAKVTRLVPDADITGESWLTKPTKMDIVGALDLSHRKGSVLQFKRK